MNKNCLPLCGLMFAATLAIAQSIPAQTIPIYSLANAPTVDGHDGDWDDVPATIVPLKKTKPDSVVKTRSVSIRGGTHSDRVFLFVEWDDDSEDTVHKPWVWKDELNKYVKGPQREDRLAVQFSTDENYSTNWRSGEEFTADTWHWKASRSNPLGLAHDKSLVVSRGKLLRAYKLSVADGGNVYIARPSDSGDKIYKTTRYRRFDQPLMPKYLLTESPRGSVADVAARGVWSQGKWRLELSRKLSTGNADDVVLPQQPGSVAGGIAVFDHSENDDHAISDTLTFDFVHQPWRTN
ncbi:MAG: ethylbenzene dehydrogenase-related protein [Sedimenticolaceae bacterium]